MARLLTSPRKLGSAPTLTVRARKVRPGKSLGAIPQIEPEPGLNQVETFVARSLRRLRINFQTQVNFMGGSILGGARADFVLPDYKIVLLPDGPFHRTDYGLGRDMLVDQTYRAAGYTVIHFLSSDVYREDFDTLVLSMIGVPA